MIQHLLSPQTSPQIPPAWQAPPRAVSGTRPLERKRRIGRKARRREETSRGGLSDGKICGVGHAGLPVGGIVGHGAPHLGHEVFAGFVVS